MRRIPGSLPTLVDRSRNEINHFPAASEWPHAAHANVTIQVQQTLHQDVKYILQAIPFRHEKKANGIINTSPEMQSRQCLQ